MEREHLDETERLAAVVVRYREALEQADEAILYVLTRVQTNEENNLDRVTLGKLREANVVARAALVA